jgi:hypothetical protein
MTTLLTWNGIPPQIIGSLDERHRFCVLNYASYNKDERYENWESDLIEPIQPFASFATPTVSSFTRWGARISSSRLRLISSQLALGEAAFQGPDSHLHSDIAYARSQKLEEEGLLTLRMLCVSSIPAIFVNLTGRRNMSDILDQHRQNNTLYENNGRRLYERSLLTLAQDSGEVVKPRPWDVIVFDGATPHLPQSAPEPHRRILQQAWIEMRLPNNWRTRVERGDVPKFQPG